MEEGVTVIAWLLLWLLFIHTGLLTDSIIPKALELGQ